MRHLLHDQGQPRLFTSLQALGHAIRESSQASKRHARQSSFGRSQEPARDTRFWDAMDKLDVVQHHES